MKKQLLTALFLFVGAFSFAQFTTGTVPLTGSTRTLKIDTNSTTVTMTLTGSSTAWLGVGFGGNSMATVVDMFIWNSTTDRDYMPPGGHVQPQPDAAGAQSWTIVSDTVSGSTRTVVATRSLISSGDYTFLNNNSSIPIIFSEGSSITLGYHGNNPHASQTLTRTALGVEDFSLNASQVYPNPSNGNFLVKTKTTLSQINIYTQTGAFVKTVRVEQGNDTSSVDTGELQKGVYLIELVNATEKSWKKIIVE
ncbi:T9SS type A sorting domain-containing protein [Flavobacterium sp.]|uniref:T9SS type A sorting domain-containing protein n=1 Tax=Flavobacterium sp. TaxID=239 RepID=UPI0025D9217C|nr:T9SS type A sorting domain-containing protein [Flavobacterium sp.]